MTEQKAEVKKIVLDLGGKEIDLTPYQAKVLAKVLGEMFTTKVEHYPVYVEHHFAWPYPYPSHTWGTVAEGATGQYDISDQTVTVFLDIPDVLPFNASGDCYYANLRH